MKRGIFILVLFLFILSGCASQTKDPKVLATDAEKEADVLIPAADIAEETVIKLNGTWVSENNVEYKLEVKGDKVVLNGKEGYIYKSDLKEHDLCISTADKDSKPKKSIFYYVDVVGDDICLWSKDSKGKFSVSETLKMQEGSTINTDDNTQEEQPFFSEKPKDSSGTGSSDNDENKPSPEPPKEDPKPSEPSGHWEERTVLVRDAWDEQVVVKEGWTEQVLVEDGWTESYEECVEYTSDTRYYYVCRANGQKYYDSTQCAHECESSFYEATEYGEPYCSRYETKTINHPAEYKYIEHEPEYTTVHHEAEYKTERVWIED